jgi:hypothetical protein
MEEVVVAVMEARKMGQTMCKVRSAREKRIRKLTQRPLQKLRTKRGRKTSKCLPYKVWCFLASLETCDAWEGRSGRQQQQVER